MRTERGIEILAAGRKAALEQVIQNPARVEDYPHDYKVLYGWLEDKLFDLYDAIEGKRLKKVRITSGEIIITVSEIIELADSHILWNSKLEKLSKKKGEN